jgi:rhamnogalacturonan acetylesterase
MKIIRISLFLIAISMATIAFKERKPVLYIIGDSTVKNGDGKPSNQLQGWGSYMASHFDTTKITIQNHAIGGRSSRTFLTEGRWDKIIADLQPGDFVIMQFGHNDSGPLDDTARARGTIKGIGDDSTKIYNPIRKTEEWVHSYGWYLRKYVNDAKAKGATAIICSPIPRNDWKDGKVTRSNDSYTKWAKDVAEATGAYYIDLNNKLGDAYEKLGKDSTTTFFPQEHTHTNGAGAAFNAEIVVSNMKDLKKSPFKKYLLK